MGNYNDEVKATQTSLESALGQLTEIRSSFIEVAKLFRDVEGINKRYAEIIKGALPQWGQDAEYKFDVENADDKAYFKNMSKLFDRIPDEERLNALIALVKDIQQPLASYQRKQVKLKSTASKLPPTVKDENGKSVPNPELAVTRNRLVKVGQTVTILSNRLDDAVSRFLKMRRTMLKRILGQSEMMVKLFEGEEVTSGIDPRFREAYARYSLKTVVGDIAELERRVCGKREG